MIFVAILFVLIHVILVNFIDAFNSHTWRVTSSIYHDNVTIKLHFNNENQYHIKILFDSHDCDVYDKIKVEESNHSSNFIHRHLGPHEMIVRLEGYTLMSQIPLLYRECNHYSTIFPIYFDGLYNLKIERLRRNFSAINYFHQFYPPLTFEVFIDEIIHLEYKNHNHSCLKHWTAINNNYFSMNPILFLDLEASKRDVSLSTHIHLESSSLLSTTKCSSFVDNYEWKYPCKNETKLIKQNLQNIKILISGDSHGRHLAKYFVKKYCGLMNYEPRSHFYETYSMNHLRCPNVSIHFIQQEECGFSGLGFKRDYDYLIYNCGHHLSDGVNHYSMDTYTSTIRESINYLMSIGFSSSRLIWYENVAQMIRNDSWVILKRDWRTEHRLYTFNRIVAPLFMSRNISIVTSFYETLAMNDKLCDNAHYSNETFMEPLLQQIYQLINKT